MLINKSVIETLLASLFALYSNELMLCMRIIFYLQDQQMRIKYLIPALLAFVAFSMFASCQEFPKIIWGYWQQGVQNNRMIGLYEKHRKQVLKDWQVIILDKHTVGEYLSKIPFYKNDVDSYVYMAIQHKADYIRHLLLSHYGGVWMDISSILLQDFSWLQMRNLRENPHVLNKYGEEPDVFYFSYIFGSKEKYFDNQTHREFEVAPGYESWFIAAKPNTVYMRQLTELFRLGLSNGMFRQNSRYIDDIVEKQKIEMYQINNMPYMGFTKILFTLIQRKQRELDKMTKENNLPRQLVSWYYKIWHMKSQVGPFTTFFKWGHITQIPVIIKLSKKQIEEQTNNYNMRYFIKLIGVGRSFLDQILFKQEEDLTFEAQAKRVSTLQSFQFQRYFCPSKFKIYNQSLFYIYFLKQLNVKIDAEIEHDRNRVFGQVCYPLLNFTGELQKVLQSKNSENMLDVLSCWKSNSKYSMVWLLVLLAAVVNISFMVVNLYGCFKRWYSHKGQQYIGNFQESNYTSKKQPSTQQIDNERISASPYDHKVKNSAIIKKEDQSASEIQ